MQRKKNQISKINWMYRKSCEMILKQYEVKYFQKCHRQCNIQFWRIVACDHVYIFPFSLPSNPKVLVPELAPEEMTPLSVRQASNTGSSGQAEALGVNCARAILGGQRASKLSFSWCFPKSSDALLLLSWLLVFPISCTAVCCPDLIVQCCPY